MQDRIHRHGCSRSLSHLGALCLRNPWLDGDPYVLTVGGVDFAIDLGAEHLMAAKRDGVQIAVEIKSFLGPSLITDFHAALGQFLNYQLALEQTDPTRQLYLAVPLDAYLTFFQLPFAQTARDRYAVRLLIYDPAQPEVLTWTPHPPIE